jgi:hypothetical protein
MSLCFNGAVVAGGNGCTTYDLVTDQQVRHSAETELEFELTVKGEARASASWKQPIHGIAAAEVAANLEATFNLHTDLQAYFSSSDSFRNHSSTRIAYDPAQVQLQWWRVGVPTLRYVEIVEIDACGDRLASTDVFLSDLRSTQLELACQPIDYEGCRGIQPTPEAVQACGALLIGANDPRRRSCTPSAPTP